MFDKHLNVDMLDYNKLFEESYINEQNQEISALSSIKEERESKEDLILTNKASNLYSSSKSNHNRNDKNDGESNMNLILYKFSF